MASLFSLSSSSSSFLCSNKSIKLFSPPTRTPTFCSRSFSVKSLSSPETTTLSPTVQSFWRWVCDKGVIPTKSPPVKPAVVPEGLGLVAQRDFSRNEVVLEIPSRLWINADTVAASEIGKVCGGLKPWASIALFLIREKSREDSPWRSYLDILPKITNSTIFWSEEELSELQGTQLLSTTLGVKEYVQSEFLKVEEEVILPNKHLFPSITPDDFLWAFGILRSRAFSRGQNLVLVPPADLVLIQYDLGKSNAEFALDYGFIEPKPERNTYTLTLEISESDPFFGDKLDIAESNGQGETAYFDICLGCPLPPAMLQYLRLVALGGTDAFLLESVFRNTVWGHLELPVSRANEELICRVVRDACRTALSSYSTTIEEDEKIREGRNLKPRLEIAVGIRAGEKKVLEQIDGIFKKRELELDGLEYYQERRLRDLGLVGEQGEIIFWESK
ncbi:PREDICTED: ribulose-1,5 bisphosphate carboxylase/oxygenase large subunit N-methyltransferase, chloroplastic isoform X2 [Nelumbo nucifera]|uniref:Ribulose-1,5 bisphosphate carboxylase/oxygenase large subunit N-methyltransferase, chloroplastic isoform X2 n=1 Tax=Nelumbo nucifera TaxID=4432 RepID=A0A1U8A8J4_NELNU|nr:PREDICTED: ribulose-1,5 bisphosphate carboxylase/oxygenase large subunit N-methyltransferase, chloroplastic isoform X2 [Nelumbo nucifera]